MLRKFDIRGPDLQTSIAYEFKKCKKSFFQQYATITLTKQLILNTFLQQCRRRRHHHHHHHHHHHQVVCIAASLIACCHAQVTQNAGNIKKFRKKNSWIRIRIQMTSRI